MEQNNKSWADYYVGHQRNFSNIVLHFPYLFAILWCRPRTILEIGCGSADHSMFLKKKFKKLEISFLDNDEKILANAKSAYADFIANTYLVNILDNSEVQAIPRFDVIMSQGLMEHFEDAEFTRIIDNFRGKTGNFIFSIPSNCYPTYDFGNEILRSQKEVQALLNAIPNIKHNIAGYFDIGIKTKLVGARVKKGIFQKLKYLMFASNHILVNVTYLK
uniref:class I SAM-dependent methyltransferase n=1 Tax=Flavobacterium sp. TaxID=239 RepID=UPI004047E12D